MKLSREELEYLARPLGGEEAVLQRLWQHRAQLLVVTDGAGPIAWHTRAASGTVETFQVTTLDTTAAGDAFVGGLLFHLTQHDRLGEGVAAFVSRHDDVAAAMRFAAAVGALAVTRKGAFAAMPTVQEVNQLLS